MFEIGTSLREARLRKGLDFPEVEYATKVRGRYLRALEDEEFDALPAPTYVKGFLRTYADYLGLDGQLYVDEFNSRYIAGEPEPPLRRSTAVPRHSHRVESRVLVLALGLIGVVTALVIAAWKFGGADQATPPPSAAKSGKTAPAAPTAATLILTAKGGSYVRVKLKSNIGRQVYAGTMEKGQQHRFYAKALWIAASKPSHLRVTLNGRAVTLPATVKRKGVIITKSGLRSPAS